MAKKKERSSQEVKDILAEARKRFKRCVDWEATARARFRDDIKIDAADAYNMYQWPADVQGTRSKRPMLTINRIRQHNLDILNDARQSRVAIKVRPLRSGASYQSAEMLDGLIKHIEYISNAESAYQMALGFAVRGGIGWVRLVTDYMGDDSFDQEIFIRPVMDPLSIYLDPDITEFNGSDARFGFVFTEMVKEEFDKAYPKYKETAADNELAPEISWGTGEKVRIAEYFRAVEDEDKLVAFVDPETGEEMVERASKLDEEKLASVIDDPRTEQRSIVLTKIEHFKIIGDNLADEKVWPGSYIPLLRCVGEESVIDGMMDRKGHTRALIDAQRMFNYNASAAVEYGALQSKTPYIAAAAAIEEYEEYWKNANTANYSVLPYKHIDDDGNPIPKPERQQPPTGAPVFMQGMRDAMEQMYLVSGQNQADFGQPSNEQSGVAIQQRQRQGDNATYHYLSHQAQMILFLGKQIIDLVSRGEVYDTARMLKFRDDAGNETEVMVDPNAPEAYQEEEQDDGTKVAVLNPKMGVYDVQADVGPAYATRRQEAFAAFSQLLGSNKELISLVGDIWMRFADIEGGEEASKRLKRMVPSQALHDGPPPDVMALQQQIQAMQAMMGGLEDKLASKEADHANDQEKNAISAYDSQTKRLGAVKEALALDPEGLLLVVKMLLDEAAATSGALDPALDTQPYIEAPPPEAISPALGGAQPPPMIPQAPGAEE